jgi:hypothetical protein
MEPRTCDQCGQAFEHEGIRHRRRLFCSDECCEAFEDEFMVIGEPDSLDLDEELDDIDPLDDADDLDTLDDDGDDLDPLDDDDY